MADITGKNYTEFIYECTFFISCVEWLYLLTMQKKFIPFLFYFFLVLSILWIFMYIYSFIINLLKLIEDARGYPLAVCLCRSPLKRVEGVEHFDCTLLSLIPAFSFFIREFNIVPRPVNCSFSFWITCLTKHTWYLLLVYHLFYDTECDILT